MWKHVTKCRKCAKMKPSSKGTTHTWPVEDRQWERIHIDHAFVPGIGLLLIVVDSFSGWPEVFRVADQSAKTVKAI